MAGRMRRWAVATALVVVAGVGVGVAPASAVDPPLPTAPGPMAPPVVAGASSTSLTVAWNPPFNDGDWGGAALQGDPRWAFGAPPAGSANFAWLQHVVHHLAPGGRAGVVLANGSLSSRRSGEGEIRRRLVEAGLVECIIALPGQLFYSTQIPACVWLLAKGRARPDALLFVDARAMGAMIGRTQRALGAAEIVAIAEAVRAWRGEGGPYRDVPGFCRAARLPEVERHGFVLTPGRYVGEATAPAPAEAPAERLRRLSGVLEAQIVEGTRLDAEVLRIVRSFGDGG